MRSDEVTIGGCRLLCGDALTILPTLGQVDIVITDPPYSNVIHKGARGGGFDQTRLINFDAWSQEEAVAMAQMLCNTARRWVILTMDWRHAATIEATLPHLFIRAGIWIKPNGAPQFTGDRPGTGWESVVMLHRPGKKRWNNGGHHAVWTIPKIEGRHPAEKPLNLYRCWLQQFTEQNELILDPYAGRFTSGIAALQMGRGYIGIEKDPYWFYEGCRRVEAAYAQLDLYQPQTWQPPQQLTLVGR